MFKICYKKYQTKTMQLYYMYNNKGYCVAPAILDHSDPYSSFR